MTLAFFKENTTHTKAAYGNLICNARYSVFNNQDELVGQYFIGNAIDYFCWDAEDFGAATCIFSIDKWSNNIVNQKDNAIVGKYQIDNEVYLDIENVNYQCSILTKTIKEYSFLFSSEQEQAFFTLKKQREKQASKSVIENSGSIETNSSKLTWIFACFYYVEKMLQSS
jgi:hypothetical protein